MSNNSYFGNPYTWGGNYNPGTSYVPQTGDYSAVNRSAVPPRFSSIPGRMVNNLDEITPQEVPMDGSVSLFPQNDYSAIYAKTWTKDGRITTVKYIPEQPQATTEQKSPLEQHLDRIEQKLSDLDRKLNRPRNYQKRTNSHSKKEMNENE